jgi:hypothetical protein
MDEDQDRDAEALTWADETDPTHVAAAVGPAVDAPTRPRPGDGRSGTGSLLLVGYGVFVGVYLLYTIGWAISVLRNTLTLPDLVSEAMYQLGELLAIVAPALWYIATLVFTRERRALVPVLWLVLGAIVLVPWPFILSGRG